MSGLLATMASSSLKTDVRTIKRGKHDCKYWPKASALLQASVATVIDSMRLLNDDLITKF